MNAQRVGARHRVLQASHHSGEIAHGLIAEEAYAVKSSGDRVNDSARRNSAGPDKRRGRRELRKEPTKGTKVIRTIGRKLTMTAMPFPPRKVGTARLAS